MKAQSIFFMTLPLLISACTPGGNSTSQNSPERPTYEGDVYGMAKEIYANENHLYPCDRILKDKAIKISQFVETNRKKISDLIEKKSKTDDEFRTYFKIGSVSFYDYDPKREIKDQWIEEYQSWDQANEIYEKISSGPDDEWSWIKLNAIVRSVILMDGNRVLGPQHPGLRHNEKERIQRISSLFDQCEKDENCTSLSLPAQDLTWLFEGLWHQRSYSYLNDGQLSYSRRRDELKWLKKQMDWMKSRYEFFKNPLIQVKQNQLIVPLNLQAFGSGASKIVELIEKNWSLHGLVVKVESVTGSEGYTIEIKDTPGERAYVSTKDHKMVLFPPVRTSTLIHEFGHILGLNDSYYDSYNQTSCSYLEESNSADIMSESATGKVLQSHVEQIKKAYGL